MDTPIDPHAPVLAFRGVTLCFDPGRPVLDGVDWQVGPGERWAVLGANGSGKTSLLRLAGGWLFPTGGTVDVLGHRLGRVDVRTLRRRLGYASGALTAQMRISRVLSASELRLTCTASPSTCRNNTPTRMIRLR